MIGIFLVMILFFTIIPIGITVNDNNYPLDGGWLEEIDGVKILHINGSYYDMGYQHGYLFKNEIPKNIRLRNNSLSKRGWTFEKRAEVWNIQKNYLPQEYIEEIRGMADGSGFTFEEIAIHNMWIGVFNLMSCWGAAIWGDATANGELYHVRSCDGNIDLKDPISGTTLNENTALMIRKPDNAFSSIYPFYPGDVISLGGFNEKGVGIGELTIICSDTQFQGINSGFRMRMVLDYAADVYQAIEIMNSNRTCGWNFIVSDGNMPEGFAIEQSANYEYTGSWCDPIESTNPFWAIKDVVRRGNCYINPLLAKNEREIYDPTGLIGFMKFIFNKNLYYGPWMQYKAISDEFEKQYGLLNLSNTMEIIRNVYSGDTNLIFKFIQIRRFYESRHLWVACPKTGDMLICFGDNTKKANENPVHYFNMFELLNSEPP